MAYCREKLVMSKNISCKYVERFEIPAFKTHNATPPFNHSMVSGSECELCAVKIVGNSNAPCIYVGGGTHGDEINGTAAVLRLIDEIAPEGLNGSLILVPVQNPLAFKYRCRMNPYDPIDLDWVGLGRPSGAYTRNLKNILCKLIQGSDCVIDLHTAGHGGFNNTLVFVPPETGDGAGKESLRLSVVFGGDEIVQGENLDVYGWPVHYALPFIAARERKSGIYAESGGGGAVLPDTRSVDYFVTGVLNVMKSLGMIAGSVVGQGRRDVINSAEAVSLSVKSPCEGVFFPEVNVGKAVENGECLGKVYGIPSGVHDIRAVESGYISWRCGFGSIARGEKLFSLSR